MGRRKSFGRMTRWKSRWRIRTLCEYATRACCYQKGSSTFWFAKGFRFHTSRTRAPGGTTHTPAPVDVGIDTTPQCSLSAPALPRRAAAERLDTPSSNPSRCALRSFVLGQAMVSLDPCCPASNGARPHPTAFPHLYVSGHPLYAVLGFVRRRVYRLGRHWFGPRLG